MKSDGQYNLWQARWNRGQGVVVAMLKWQLAVRREAPLLQQPPPPSLAHAVQLPPLAVLVLVHRPLALPSHTVGKPLHNPTDVLLLRSPQAACCWCRLLRQHCCCKASAKAHWLLLPRLHTECRRGPGEGCRGRSRRQKQCSM